MKHARQATQAFFLLLFLWLFLQTEAKGANELVYPVRIFLDADPLLLVTTFLAAHSLPGALLLALCVIVLTAVMGRVFCGWICPLGAPCTIWPEPSAKAVEGKLPGTGTT